MSRGRCGDLAPLHSRCASLTNQSGGAAGSLSESFPDWTPVKLEELIAAQWMEQQLLSGHTGWSDTEGGYDGIICGTVCHIWRHAGTVGLLFITATQGESRSR